MVQTKEPDKSALEVCTFCMVYFPSWPPSYVSYIFHEHSQLLLLTIHLLQGQKCIPEVHTLHRRKKSLKGRFASSGKSSSR